MISEQKRLLSFVCLGLLSGLVNGTTQYFLPDIQIVMDYYPSVLLGIFLYIAGQYLVYPGNKLHLLKLFILIIFSSLGWRLSINLGFMLGGPVPYGNAGAVGAFMVALGWLLAWRIRSGILIFVLVITIAGTMGGLVFQIIDATITMSEALWIFVLFTEWQSILFLGIALAYLCIKTKKITS